MKGTQMELFNSPTNLIGEDAWAVARQISGGQLDYENGDLMNYSVIY